MIELFSLRKRIMHWFWPFWFWVWAAKEDSLNNNLNRHFVLVAGLERSRLNPAMYVCFCFYHDGRSPHTRP